MSMACGAACLDCRKYAPDVGSWGYLGTPSLSTVRVSEDNEEIPFGYLYEPLGKLGLRTYDLEGFKAFLTKHDGHRMHAFGDEMGSSPSELYEMSQAVGIEASQQYEDEPLSTVDFVDGAIYELECSACEETYRAPDDAWLRSFDRLDVSTETVDLYLERLGPLSPDDGWNYHLEAIVDPYSDFIEHLPDFLKKHRSHALQAKLSR